MDPESTEMKTSDDSEKTKLTLPVSIVVAAAIIGFSILYSAGFFEGKSGPKQQGAIGSQITKPVEVSADDDAFLGPENAKVTIIEFSDYQCPFCRSFWRGALNQVKSEYIDLGKSVKFVYRDFPLNSIHPLAQKYAEGAECAGDQGKYWQMHDKIFEEQDKLGQGTISAYGVNDIKRWAVELGLNGAEFNQCLDSGKYTDEVKRDFDDGSEAGVRGTPTFFINGIPLVGSQPFESLKAVIDEELQK